MTIKDIVWDIVQNKGSISKRNLELRVSIKSLFEPCNNNEIKEIFLNSYNSDNPVETFSDLLENKNLLLPGDLSRNIRSEITSTHAQNYGFYKIGERDTIQYCYDPFKPPLLDKDCARNLYRNNEERIELIKKANNKCEICKSPDKLAIDHWRAHSIYNINDINIVSILCEKCNNIHHNYDGSKLAIKYISDIEKIKNWIIIEKRIRDNGFLPNNDDLNIQLNNINIIKTYWVNNDMNINAINEWFKPLNII